MHREKCTRTVSTQTRNSIDVIACTKIGDERWKIGKRSFNLDLNQKFTMIQSIETEPMNGK